MEEKTLFGQRIRTRLNVLGKNQSWLAEEIGVSNETVSKWIRVGSASMENVPKIAAALACSCGYLLGDEEDHQAAEVAEIVRGMSAAQKTEMKVIGLALRAASEACPVLTSHPTVK